MGKPFFKSKTFWVAVATIALGGLQAVNPLIPAQYTPIILTILGILNLVLRFLTTEPIVLPQQPEEPLG